MIGRTSLGTRYELEAWVESKYEVIAQRELSIAPSEEAGERRSGTLMVSFD